jgi:hypothetical protein
VPNDDDDDDDDDDPNVFLQSSGLHQGGYFQTAS